MAGLLLVALTFWRPFHLFVLTWAVVPVLGAAPIPGDFNPHRYYMAVPLLFTAVALGVEVLWRLRAGPVGPLLLVVFLVAGVWAGVANVRYFFGRVVGGPAPISWRWPGAVIAAWARGLEPGAQIWVLGPKGETIYQEYIGSDWTWLVAGPDVRSCASPQECIPSPDPTKGPLYYVLASTVPQPEIEALIQSRYPNARDLGTLAARDEMTIRLFRIPASGL